MIKKFIASFILCFLTVMAPIQAMAASEINTSKKCTLIITFHAGEEKAPGVEFKIYRVANITPSGDFSICEPFKSYPVSYNMYKDPDTWRNLAQTLSGYVAADKLQPDYSDTTDNEATAYFEGIPVGWYLAVGSKYISGKNIYIPEAFMICIPNTDEEGVLRYDLVGEVKYNSYFQNEYFSLKVLKVWNDNNASDRPEEIEVEIYGDGILYETVTLNRGNNWRYELKNLSRDAIWTIREKSVPDGYVVCVEQQRNSYVLTNTKDPYNPPPPPSSSTTTTTTTTTTTVNTTATTEPSSSPTSPKDSTLPKTGLLWWPVPCLFICGLAMIILGVISRKGAANGK